ncbi:hypothetical protein BDEG_24902 [Batrachochytrium dendrobatidis JEL423]|uniref:CUE domain-containing protein n=1 Tax=Batrachochytrium dendrobatidis (strain JEL423) TaxID=403673 RepID=A0A177WPI9_BATDL|nr:hypothetical protein BDEG_24902 [Batrachochytrium dendrobatidis JEL423]
MTVTADGFIYDDTTAQQHEPIQTPSKYNVIQSAASLDLCLSYYVPPIQSNQLFSPVSLQPELQKIQRQLLTINIDQALYIIKLPDAVFWSCVLWQPLNQKIESSTTLSKDHSNDDPTPILAWLDSYLEQKNMYLQRILFHQKQDSLIHEPTDLLVGLERRLEYIMFCIAVRLLTPPSKYLASSNLQSQETHLTFLSLDDPTHQNWSDCIWLDICRSKSVFTSARLVEICKLYAIANTELMPPLISHVFLELPAMLDEIIEAFVFVLDKVHSIQRRRQKGANVNYSNNRKQKSKASLDVPDTASTNSTTDSVLAISDNSDILNELEFFMDLVQSIEAVVCGGGDLVITKLFDSPLVQNLVGIYDLCTLHFQASTGTPLEYSTHVYDSLDGLDKEANPIARLSKYFKEAVLSLLWRLVDTAFLQRARQHLDKLEEFESILSALCDFSLPALELCTVEGHARYLCDAPLLLDFEIKFGFCDQLQSIIQAQEILLGADQSEGFDSTRIDYLVMSLEQLVTFSGNANTRRAALRDKENQLAAACKKETHQNSPETLHTNKPSDNTKNEELMNRTISISLVHDLFPELGDGFIEACLVAMNDDHELVTMKILENDLPEYVKHLDRNLPRSLPNNQEMAFKTSDISAPLQSSNLVPVSETPNNLIPSHAPIDTILSQRRNIFDGDQFDIFNAGTVVDTAKVSLGKTNRLANVESERPGFIQKTKALILETQYEDYDDEYDDTYDSSDIKLAGTIELHMIDEDENIVDGKSQKKIQVDQLVHAQDAFLIGLYSVEPKVFDRSQRKTARRAQIRSQTGMSDEQLEGWFKMLERNPRKDLVLEKHEWRGNKSLQNVKTEPSTTGSENNSDTNIRDPESSEPTPSQSRKKRENGPASRGDRGRGGRGGKRGGNHNRQAGFDKKISKGMAKPDV